MPRVPAADEPAAAVPAAAIILAGGRGSRLGGRDKPALVIDGRTLLDTALAAATGGPTVVVGPARALPPGVLAAREDPPGGGPAAALAAGVVALPALPADAPIAVLAADLPGIDRAAIGRLCAALDAARSADRCAARGAVMIDPNGRRQYLIGVWRLRDLQQAVAAQPNWSGRPLRELLAPIPVVEVASADREAADVDTPADWQRWQSAP